MAHRLRGAAAIVGVGTTASWHSPGMTAIEQLAEAALAALADAGIGVREVDGIFANTMVQSMPALSVAEYLGLRPRFVESSSIGGASFVHYLMPAMLALDAGECDVALIAYGSDQRSAGGRLVTTSEQQPHEAPYRPRYPIAAYALAAARHMHDFGTTREQLAEVAVAARAWARLNPDAFERGPLAVADVLASRMICDPLSKLDCCLVTDGGGALVLTRADRARDAAKPPVAVLGCATATDHRGIAAAPDLTVTAAAESGRRAYAMAGVGPADVHLLALYDAFTINTVLFLEDLGFCPKGEGGRFVEGGRIGPGGALPVNTNGGGLSCCHPGMYGIYTVIEAVRQLRGEAGARQAGSPEIALAHGNGGLFSSQVTALLGTAAAV